MKTEFPLSEVLSQLSDEGFIQPIERESISSPLEMPGAHGTALPWFVKLFIGIAAWIAAILFTVFLFTIDLLDEDTAIGFGLAFCMLAIALNRFGRDNTFWAQLSLASSFTGQVLVIIGLFEMFDELLPIVIFVSIIEVFIIWLHRDTVLRFMSTLVISVFILALIVDGDMYNFLHFFIFILAAGSLLIYIKENHLKLTALGDVFMPVGSAIIFSFLGILVLPVTDEFHLGWWITAIVLFSLLLFLLSQIALDLGYMLHNRVVLSLAIGCTLLLVPSFRMPGILAALLVLALGFWRNNRGLIGLASIFLVFYIWAYYYLLEWTLLAKSLVLFGSGLILLVLRYFVVRFTSRAGGEA